MGSVSNPPTVPTLFANSNAASGHVLDATYQNLSGKPMLVTVAMSLTTKTAEFYCDSAANPSTLIGKASSAGATAVSGTVSFMVPPLFYYKSVSSGGGTATLVSWTESA